MPDRTIHWLRGGALAAVLGLVAYGLVTVVRANQQGNAAVAVTAADQVLNLSGPYTHENLAVYVLSGPQQADRQFITLREGIDAKTVAVKEKAQEEVNEVVIENNSDDYLFLQEGDIITGGKQDRTIYASLIVPPRQKEQIKVFCVEQSRWTAGAGGGNFGNAANPSLAPKEVRQAAKYQNDQSAVWANVATQRVAINSLSDRAPHAPAEPQMQRQGGDSESSLNTATDDPATQRVVAEFRRALEHALELHPNAVGVAIVVNGQLEEVNVYPNKQLLEKQFPRILGGYAVQARMTAKDARPAISPSAVAQQMHQRHEATLELTNFEIEPAMIQLGGGNGRGIVTDPVPNADANDLDVIRRRPNANAAAETVINADNTFQVQEDASKYKSVTQFQGKPVHVQYMSRTQQPQQPQGQRPGNQLQRPMRQQVEQRIINQAEQAPQQLPVPSAPAPQ